MAVKDIVKGICNITRCKYDVYTKEKTDELLNDKANSSDVYTKEETYSQTETNNLLNAKLNSSSITSGTSDPSGGSDGDIYFQYQ